MNFDIKQSLSRAYLFRAKLLSSIKTDVRQQYSGSALGLFWLLLFPFLQLSIFAVLYAFIFKIRPTGLTEYKYTLLVFSGLVPLLSFSQSIAAGSACLIANKNLLLNTVFPAELVVVKAVVSSQMPMVVGMIITLIYSIFLGTSSIFYYSFIPIFWFLLTIFCFGICWILSLISLVFKDIQQGIGIVLMLTLILSPFAYTEEMVPSSLKLVIYLNPMSYYVKSFQSLIVYGSLPSLLNILACFILAFTSFFIGLKFHLGARGVFFDHG